MFCAWPPVCFEEGLVQQTQLERLHCGPETPLSVSESTLVNVTEVNNEQPASTRPSFLFHPDTSQSLPSSWIKGLPSIMTLAKRTRPDQQVDKAIPMIEPFLMDLSQ